MASTAAALSCPKIMQRPAANATGTEKGVHGTTGAKEKGNAPTILQKKGAFSPSTVILEKEEKRDDNGITIMKPSSGGQTPRTVDDASKSVPPSSSASPSSPKDDTAAATDADAKTAPWNPLEEVDSALLSALCDPRERKALFRLEQVVLDFMKDKSSASMEVGGALNSIVLNGSGGGGAAASNGGGEAPPCGGPIPAGWEQTLQDLQYQHQRGLRQTSFQRLILHRLADRFNILREQLNNATNHALSERGLLDVGGMGNSSTYPGLIRLIKTSESRVPSHLLIDIDLSLLVNYKNPRARNYGGGINNNITSNALPNTNNYEDGVKNLTEKMALATLETPSVSTGSASSKKKDKKMVIMKRNSSSESNSEGKGKGKQKGKSRRKKLEDREKAYVEARARIFGISESSGTENKDGGGGDSGEKGGGSSVPQAADSQDVAATPLGSCHSSFSVENDVTSPSISAVPGGVAEHIFPSQLISSTPSMDQSSPPSPEPQQGDKESPNRATSATEIETSRQTSSFSSACSVPAAATSGAVFKAVYRNRQQEENDPDFKRRSDVRPSYVPYVPANPYGLQGGYGLGQAAGGQPPAAAAMMAMHAQQQVAAAHQPHFYHGAGPQFPTPQDTYAPQNVGGGPTPQWATAPHRVYYPPQQQQGHQEKHPQAWQPRSNNANQMQPNSRPGSNSGNNYGAQFNANAMSNPPLKQPNKVLWGLGSSSPDGAAEGATFGRKNGAAGVYKSEDFPALG